MSLTTANFREVYRRHSRDVYRFALFLTADAARAEDLTAEAFFRIWASPAPTQLKTVKSYLLAIVRNLHTENWRSDWRQVSLPETLPHMDRTSATLDARAELERVLAALQKLAATDRAAVLLRGEHGLSYEEIAHILNISAAAVRVKVHRARKDLMFARNPQPSVGGTSQ